MSYNQGFGKKHATNLDYSLDKKKYDFENSDDLQFFAEHSLFLNTNIRLQVKYSHRLCVCVHLKMLLYSSFFPTAEGLWLKRIALAVVVTPKRVCTQLVY